MFVSRIVPKEESNEVHSHFCHSILDFSLRKSLHKKSVEAKSKRCKLKRLSFLMGYNFIMKQFLSKDTVTIEMQCQFGFIEGQIFGVIIARCLCNYIVE